MTVARKLPTELPPRFHGAARAVVRSGDASFEAVVAERFALRLRGLAGLAAGGVVPLLFPRCRSLHTFGMRAEIDVVWLDVVPDGEARVVGVEAGAGRSRLLRAPRSAKRGRGAALELAAGDASRLGLVPGGHLELAFGPPA